MAPEVGGGFGSKLNIYAEEVGCAWAAMKLGRPVKWIETRSEGLMVTHHGRDQIDKVRVGAKRDGTITAWHTTIIADCGAYQTLLTPMIPPLSAFVMCGVYKTPAVQTDVINVMTNKFCTDAIRGAGRPEATHMIETVLDQAAAELGMDPVEIRRKNFIPTDAFPYQTPVALQYDSGDYFSTLDMAMKNADWAGFEGRRAEAKKRGKLRGIGISTYLEACGIAPSAVVGSLGARAGLYECGSIRVHPTGSVTVFTGTHSHGQGHETTFAQLVSDTLGISIDAVEVSHGDTNKIPFGMGTYGSRSLAVGGSALVKAMDKIITKAKRIAAHLMEASVADVEFKDGTFTVAGTDKSVPFGTVALTAYVPHNYPITELEPGLEETAFYDPLNFTYPGGCHICEVEIDPDTGVTTVIGFTAVDDVGRVINPMIVEGQIHGGVTQGIGQALLENCVYDEQSGQLLTGSYMDYCMPRADDVPSYKVGTHATMCTHNPLGSKGVGEVGAIGSTPAVINAVLDALAPLGVQDISMPATPLKVWQAIQGAPTKMAAE